VDKCEINSYSSVEVACSIMHSVEASTVVLLGVLVPTAGGLLSLLPPPATKCVVHYLLLQQLVLDLKACRVCTLAVDVLVAADDSAMQRQHAALVGSSCGRMRTMAEAKAALRACPSVCGVWTCALLMLASFGSVCWCKRRCTNSSMRV
jgi:hypothetical protein